MRNSTLFHINYVYEHNRFKNNLELESGRKKTFCESMTLPYSLVFLVSLN